MPQIVQFTHPGSEHSPDRIGGNYKSWNKGKHKRKFLLSFGEYVKESTLLNGKLIFWGEWEPPSLVKKLNYRPNLLYPKWLHIPCLPKKIPESDGYQSNFQNTDPYVFAETFRYFVCKQFKPKTNKITGLAKLEKGSLVLFGSTNGMGKDNAFFQLDTVFVVGGYIEYNPSSPKTIRQYIDDQYYNLVYKMAFDKITPSLNLRFYFGATYKNQFNGMYSFSPSLLWNNKSIGFPRVKLKDIEPLTNNLNAAPKIINKSASEVRTFWKKIKSLSRMQGYVEGVKFFLPTENKYS